MAKVSIKNGTFMYNGIGIAHGPDDQLDLENVHFEGNKIAGMMEQRGLSRKQMLPFFETLAKHQGPFTTADVEHAVEKSGLSDHIKEHGWEIASFVLEVSQALAQRPELPAAMLAWAHSWS